MYKFLTREIIIEINKFLSYEDYNFNVLLSETEFNRIDTLFIDNQIIIDSEKTLELWFLRKFLITVLQRHSKERQNRRFIVFSDFADKFKEFRFAIMTKNLNDKRELEWFESVARTNSISLSLPISSFVVARTLRDSGNVQAKYTVTNLNKKEKYMISNYSRYKRTYATWDNGNEIIKRFEKSIKSHIPIRGYVRYLSETYNPIRDFLTLLSKVSSSGIFIDPLMMEFCWVVMSYYVKGNCMATENEYRFTKIKGSKWKQSTTIKIKPVVKNSSKKVCIENPHYLENSHNCLIQVRKCRCCNNLYD